MIWLSSVGITWIDAPESQYASLNQDYKVWHRKYKYTLSNKSNKRNLLFIQSVIFFQIRCVVRANPPANIDWLKESLIISTGELDFQIGIDIFMFCYIPSFHQWARFPYQTRLFNVLSYCIISTEFLSHIRIYHIIQIWWFPLMIYTFE